MRIVYFLILLLTFQAFSLSAQDFKVVGYLPYYRFSAVDQIEYDKLTHLMLAFLNPDTLGNLSIGDQDIVPIVTKARTVNPDIEIFISLAGGGLTEEWANAYNKFMQPSLRSSFVHSLIDYVETHGLDGIDVDLEWGDVNALYSPFAIELADSLKAHGKQMSSAWPATTRYADISDDALARFDFVNLMAYDLTGPWQPNNPGQHSPYSFAQTGINYWKNEGVTGDRLTLGVPFYGRDWSTGKTGQAFTYGSMIALDTAYAWVDQVGGKYYNGIPTIQSKLDLAISEVSGIMIWELGQDALGTHQHLSLLRAIDNRLKGNTQSIPLDRDLIQARFVPNPFQNELSLIYEGIPLQVHIRIRDIQGRLIVQHSGTLTSSGFSWQLAHLIPGLYICEIQSATQTFRQKLIKH